MKISLLWNEGEPLFSFLCLSPLLPHPASDLKLLQSLVPDPLVQNIPHSPPWSVVYMEGTEGVD